MSLHSPEGYIGYELSFLKTLRNNLVMFCNGCHTNADYGTCRRCPIGNLNYKCADYLADGYKLSNNLIKIGKYIKKIDSFLDWVELKYTHYMDKQIQLLEQRDERTKKEMSEMEYKVWIKSLSKSCTTCSKRPCGMQRNDKLFHCSEYSYTEE